MKNTLLSMAWSVLALLMFGEVWGQINENFNSATLPSGWAAVGTPIWAAQQCEGAGALGFNASGDGAITPAITNPDKLNFSKKRSGNTAAWALSIEISNANPTSQTSGPWNPVTTITSISTTCDPNSEIDLSSYTGLRYIRFIDTRASGIHERAIDNVSISLAVPNLVVSTSSLTGFAYQEGAGPSAVQSYTLSGSNLTGAPGSITITAPTNYQVSKDNTNFSGSTTVDYATATLSSQTIYVRLKSSLAIGDYNGEIITHSGGGDTSPPGVTCNGSVVCAPPSSQATTFGSSNLAANQMDLSWVRGTGNQVLVVARSGSAVNANPSSGQSYTANAAFGSGSQIGTGNWVVYSGTGTGVTVTALSASTTYHYAVYEYQDAGFCYLTPALTGNATTLCSPTNASSFAATPAPTQISLSWVAPSCSDEVLVVAKQGSAVTAVPTGDGNAYTANAAFGSGTEIATGEYVVYKGSGLAVAVSALSALTNYHFTVFSRKGSAWSSGSTLNSTTLCAPPSSQATTFGSSNLAANQMDLSWVRGTGNQVLVVARSGSAVNASPSSGQSYTANAAFGSGSQIGTGNWVVYSGTGTGVTVTALSASTTYHYAVYEYQDAGFCYLTPALTGNATTLCSPTNATSFAATPAPTQISLSWVAPSCSDEVLVVAKQGSAVTAVPTGDGTAYTANAAFGSGTEIATGEYVVYKGSGLTVAVSALSALTNYHFTVFSRKGSAWSSGSTLNSTTLCAPPSSQATTFGSSNLAANQMDLSWVRGTGNQVLVVARSGSAVNANPSSGQSYTANAAFGSGSQIGTGNWVVYSGTGTGVTVTALTAGTTYHYAVYEYQDAGFCYLTPALTGNATTFAPEIQLQYPIDTDVNCGAGTVAFGSVGVGSSSTLVFRIKNLGTSALNLTSHPLVISGANPSQYNISIQPASTIAAGDFADVSVQFSPTSTGSKPATISIANNDASEGTCTISLSGTGVPANDNCSTATPLTVNGTTSCVTSTAGSTSGATSSGVSAPSCAGNIDDDVWYSFVATASSHIITVVGTSPLDAVVELRSGACNGTSVSCADVTAGGGTEVLTATGLNINETYLVRVYGYGTGAGTQGSFTLCVTTPPPPYYFRSKGDGAWSSAATWEVSTDNLNWSDASAAPSTSDLGVTLRSPHSISFGTSTSIDQTVIQAGATLEVASGVTLTIANGDGTDLSVLGILKNAGIVTTTGTVVVGNGGKYQHNYTSGTGAIPTATWSAGSTCEILGSSGPTNLNQAYHHFIWNNAQTGNINIQNTLTLIAGDFTVERTGSGGSLRLTGSTVSELEVGGHVYISSGATLSLGNGSASCNLIINGNLNINGGTLNLMDGSSANGTVELAGNLVMTGLGTLTEGTSGTASKLIFNGTTTQSASFGILNNRVNIDINNAQGVSLNSNLSLANSATLGLISGRLSLNGYNLSMASGTSISGGSSSAYIRTNGSGVLQRAVSTSAITYPVGNSTYNPASLALSAGTATFGVLVLDAVYRDGLSGNPVTEQVVNRTWDVTGAIPSSRNLSLVVNWNAADEASAFDRNACYVSHYTNGGWSGSDASSFESGDGTTYGRTRTGITSLSPFAIGSQGALPVSLLYFEAKATPATQSVLSWQTATEQNNAYFEVERSADGRLFTAIGRVAGAGDSQQPINYVFVDEHPLRGSNYYRLRQVDYDGSSSYFGPVSTYFEGSSDAGVRLWPVPAQDQLHLEVLGEIDPEGWRYQLYDLNGRLQRQGTLSDQTTRVLLPLEGLPAGSYWLHWQNGPQSGHQRLMLLD